LYSPETTKYLIHIYLEAEGVVEKSDVVGAIFGQTEGLLGDDLDLRDLQRTGRVGRIDVQVSSKKGETKGEISIASSLDKVETALLAASLETIDRVGPCNARVTAERIEDIRITKRRKIVERAKELLLEHFDEATIDSNEILDAVREYSRIEKVTLIGKEQIPAGPNVLASDAIIVVEGRADVVNLLRYNIKNAAAVEGTNVPSIIIELCKSKTATAFLDGDRGGDLILSELLQVAEIDYVAFSPRGKSVEEMARKEIIKALRNKVPVEFITEQQEEGKPGRLPTTKSDIPRPIPVGEDVGLIGREKAAGEEISEQTTGGEATTLAHHMVQVGGHHIARFLSPDNKVILESSADEIEKILEGLNGDVTGLVIDRVLDQKIIDLAASHGLEYVAATDFKKIIKKPVSIRLIKITG
jgi:DNA primase